MELGLIGLGKIGGNMAERLRPAGLLVVGFDFNAEAVKKKLTESGNRSASVALEDLVKNLRCAARDLAHGSRGRSGRPDDSWLLPDRTATLYRRRQLKL